MALFAQLGGNDGSYNPVNPPNPDEENINYELKLVAEPARGGSFNQNSRRIKAGESTYLYAYTNAGYQFKGWNLDGEIISTESRYEYTMPEKSTTLTAVFEYNPTNPANPGANAWDGETGEVLIDDFKEGSLGEAIYQATKGDNNAISQITVIGRMNYNDFSIANNYSNCSRIDLSRTTGLTSVPSYAYDYNQSLTSIALPAGIENIEWDAFYQCTNLAEISCYAPVPPTVDSYAFYGISEGCVVRVPAASLALYQVSEGWKDFTILPLADEVNALEVNLPSDSEDGRYKNMFIELINTKNGQKLRYVISDRQVYTFYNLMHNSQWNVYLKNAQDAVLGEIDNIDIQKEDVSVTFTDVLVPRDLTLSILTPDGTDVTSQATITWTDAQGGFLTQGNQLAGLTDGTEVKYRINLPQTLGMEYVLPTEQTYTIGSSNALTISLATLPQTTLSGTVRDITTGQPVSGATVSISQSINGLYSKALNVRTDAKGLFTATIYKTQNAPLQLNVSASDYISKSVAQEDLTVIGDALSGSIDLKAISGATISLGFTYRESAVAGEEAEVQNWYNDYANVSYNIYNVTQNRDMTEFSVQYPQIVLLEEVAEGDVLRLTASSRTAAFAPVTATATIDEANRASATFDIVQLGQISASFTTTENAAVTGILYDAHGKLVSSKTYSNAQLSFTELEDGDYTLVSMAKSNLFNSIYDLAQLPATGLTEGVDYVQNSVTVRSGVIASINNDLVPTLDESRLYYTGDNTSFTVNKTEVTAGNYLTLTGHIDFKEEYADKVSDVKLIVDLPEESAFVENSVMVGSAISSYMSEGHRVTIPMENYTDRVRFCFIPTAGGSFAPSAYVQFSIGEEEVTQPIGNANLTVKNMAISVPTQTVDSIITINGVAQANSLIKVYDNNVLIGQTRSIANGSWSVTGELYKPYNPSYHEIHAEIEFSTGQKYLSDIKTVEYNKNVSQPKTITMIYNGQTIVFDQIAKTTSTDWYSYNPSINDFTFTAEFTNNDTTLVRNLSFTVLASDGTTRTIPSVFDAKTQSWVGNSVYDESNRIPVNVGVEYIATSTNVFDSQRIIDDENFFSDIILSHVVNIDTTKVDVIEASDSIIVFLYPTITGDTPVYMKIEMLPFSEYRSLLETDNYQELNMGNGIAYIKDSIINNSYVTWLWTTEPDRLMRIDISKEMISIQKRSSSSRRKTIWDALGTLLDAVLPLNIWEIHNIIQDYNEGYTEYQHWLLQYNKALDNHYQLYLKTKQLLEAKCKDGSLRLSDTAYDYYTYYLKIAYDDAMSMHEEFKRKLNQMEKDLITQRNEASILSALLSAINLIPGGSVGKRVVEKFGSDVAAVFGKDIPIWLGEMTGSTIENLIDGDINDLISNILLPNRNTAEELSTWYFTKNNHLISFYSNIQQNIVKGYKKCPSDDDDDNHNGNYGTKPITPSIDPSGYVYEGVSSNRLQGVTATAYYKEEVEDMYGDKHENIVLWDAAEYAQENPLFTDENGMYQWDVPQGLWQVKFEKEGYQTTCSEWLPVPPPQLDVNIAMTQVRQPEVKDAHAYEDGVEVTFDKYMQTESLTTDNIMVTRNGEKMEGTVELLDEEGAYEGESTTYASRVKFVPAEDEVILPTDDIVLTVSQKVKSYAGIPMQENYTQEFDVEKAVRSIVAADEVATAYEDERQLLISAQPADAAVGKKLTVKTVSKMIADVRAGDAWADDNGMLELTLDDKGQTTLTVTGELPGTTALLFSMADAHVAAQTTVKVVSKESLTTLPPVASRASGSAVYRGTGITLSCETEGAAIYYTLDGSCPCDETTRLTYDGSPIAVTEGMTIRAIAQGEDLYESDVTEFKYSIKQTTSGINLHEGWNWISHNVADGQDAATAFADATEVKSQTKGLVKDSQYGLVGNLQTLLPTEAYKVKAEKAESIILKGDEFNAGEDAIGLEKGWNWIGYPVNQIMALGEAFAKSQPNEGDNLVGQEGFAEFADGEWMGTLETLTPGRGYMYLSAEGGSILYNTAIVSNAKSRYYRGVVGYTAPWATDIYQYPDIMPITASLYVDGNEADADAYTVGAFCGTECRGVGKFVKGKLFLSVYGEGNEDITFLASDNSTEGLYNITEHLPFSANKVGSFSTPYALHIGAEATEIAQMNAQFGVTPTVAHDVITVTLPTGNIDRLSIISMSGASVYAAQHLEVPSRISVASLPEGIYIVAARSGGKTYYKKIIKVN